MSSIIRSAQQAVRVRYAPSPTGYLHLGGLRTALFNYLLAARARKDGIPAAFILRIEDTDKQRQVPGSITGLIRALQWCGLDFDEGPVERSGVGLSAEAITADADVKGFDSKGDCGPYIQSQRLPPYQAAAAELLARGSAYRCFCSSARLTSLRTSAEKRGEGTSYDRACRKLSKQESDARAAAGEAHTIRLKVPFI
jgi:nondiscriminating glutamyl-tRNA synthetase